MTELEHSLILLSERSRTVPSLTTVTQYEICLHSCTLSLPTLIFTIASTAEYWHISGHILISH